MTYINARDPRTSTPNLSPDQPLIFNGGCYCKKITYAIHLKNQEEARTLVCHCQDCKKTFGGVFGVTVKVPATAVRITGGEVMVHKSDVGAGSYSYREFCSDCGSTICTYEEQAKDHFRSIALGSLDDSTAFEPKGEFYCSQRNGWLPEMSGKAQFWKQ